MKKLMKIPREWKISRAILPGYDMESTVEKDIALNYLTCFALDKAADKAEVIHDQLKYIREIFHSRGIFINFFMPKFQHQSYQYAQHLHML
jgi:hypothetical protein